MTEYTRSSSVSFHSGQAGSILAELKSANGNYLHLHLAVGMTTLSDVFDAATLAKLSLIAAAALVPTILKRKLKRYVD